MMETLSNNIANSTSGYACVSLLGVGERTREVMTSLTRVGRVQMSRKLRWVAVSNEPPGNPLSREHLQAVTNGRTQFRDEQERDIRCSS